MKRRARRRRKKSLTGHFRVLKVRGVSSALLLLFLASSPLCFSSLASFFFSSPPPPSLLILVSSSFSPPPPPLLLLLSSSPPPLLLLPLLLSSPLPPPLLLHQFCTEHDRGSVQGRDYAPGLCSEVVANGNVARSWQESARCRTKGRPAQREKKIQNARWLFSPMLPARRHLPRGERVGIHGRATRRSRRPRRPRRPRW